MDMNYQENIENALKAIEGSAPELVGILCKRIEILQKNTTLFSKNPETLAKTLLSLFKDLTKEQIYEHHRQLKKLVSVHLKIGKLTFEDPKK